MVVHEVDFVGIAFSGGGTNVDPAQSLGGQPNFTQRLTYLSAALNNIFPVVTGLQAQDGITQHRCVYIWNEGSTAYDVPATWYDVRLFVVQKNLDSPDQIWIANGAAPASQKKSSGFDWEPDIETETNTPAFVTFTSENDAFSYQFGVKLGDIPGDPVDPWFKSFWVRRVVPAGTLSLANNYFTIIARGKKTPP